MPSNPPSARQPGEETNVTAPASGVDQEGSTARTEAPRDADVWRTDFYADAGLRIQMERRRLRMTQEEVAGELGISRASMANIENGRQRIPADVLWKLAVILGAPISTLLPGRRDA